MSRLRGSLSAKEGATKMSSSVKHQQDEPAQKSYRNGTNRYHFGMTRQRDDEVSKNGRDYGDTATEDPDLLYRKSKEHFGSWDIKEIVQNDGFGTRKQADRFDDSRLTNGRSKNESAVRQDRYDGREDSRNDRGRAGSVDREHVGSPRSRKREGREGSDSGKGSSKFGRSKNDDRDDPSRIDERDQLLREIESLAVDGRSPDRRIRAMIERFKSREEDKLKSRKEYDSPSPNREEGKSKSSGRGEARIDEANDRDRGRLQKDDRADERRSSRSKLRELDKFERDEPGRSRSVDKRADKYDSFADKKNESHHFDKNRRRSREIEDDVPRRKDSPKRRSYVYEGNPDDFDVRIQRYERGLPEPKRDPDSPRRVSLKDSAPEVGRKDSFKDHDRQVSRKSSFKSSDSKKSHSRDRESGLSRKTSFKDQGNDVYGKNSSKSQDSEKKYFGRDPEHVSRKSSFKEQAYEAGRKNSFKEQSSDYGRISLKNRDDDDEERKRKDGVSRITFKENDSPAESSRFRSCKDQESDIARVGIKEPAGETCRKNSFKEKTVEFAGIFYKEHSDDGDRRTAYKAQDNEPSKVSFQGHDDRDGPEVDPAIDEDYDFERKSSSRERDSSSKRRASFSRGKTLEASDKRSGRHCKPLSPSGTNDPDRGDDPNDRDAYDSKSWHESNRLFAVKYLRENGRHRANPEGRSEIERDPSPETRFLEYQNRRPSSEEVEQGAKPGGSNAETYNLDAGDRPRDSDARYASTRERNGATIIRIRSSPETLPERRRGRRLAQEAHAGRRRRYEAEDGEESDEDEEEEDADVGGNRRQRTVAARGDDFVQERGVPTPSRRVWNYREGGVVITDIEEGQPCLRCYDKCTGFSPHEWRKNCTSCRCPREAHDVCHEEWASVRSRLGLKGEEFASSVSCDPKTLGFAWVPPGLPAHKVEKYFSMLPKISVPKRGTAGVRYRDRELAFQLPKQDLARAYCRHLNPEHASSADDFMAARNEIALDIGSVQEVFEKDVDCGACREPLEYGDLAVSASKLGLLYHPNCFRCTSCRELLVDLAYCVHDDTLFCERHYAEQLKPRCAACDELIFSGEYTKAMNKDWHSGHFCCWQCDEPLTGQRYVLKDVNHPYCIKCYESAFANSCEECNKIIGIDSKDLSYKDKHWHEACFLCNSCRVSLVDKQFGSKVDKIYCGNCYDSQFASRCDGCGEIFRAGNKKMEYRHRQWHEKCFCCVVCKNPIGTKSFIPREQEIYCAGCYEDKFATRCVKCNKIITTGGVTYKNEPWHRDCFTCSNCNTSLAGQRFTSRDDKPYCADCFGELFAKRCTACSKPITGIGGTRFISFEDRHWHNDCFICAGCKTSLVGRGFITDGEDVICAECAKTKLM